MCLKYPGVRCKNSYKATLAQATKKTGEAYSNLSDTRNSTPEKLGLSQEKYNKKLEKETQTLREQRAKLESIKTRMDATKDGISDLKELLKDDELTGVDQQEVKDRLKKAETSYNAQLLNYDRYNNTVDGKKPSKKIGEASILQLSDDVANARAKVKETYAKSVQTESDDPEWKKNAEAFKKARSKFDALQAANSHAIKTSGYVMAGYIKDPRTSDDWDKDATFWLNEAQRSQKEGNPIAAKRLEAIGIACLKSRSVADSNYSMTVPTIVKENGEPEKLFLYHESDDNSWSWTDGKGNHYDAMDSSNGNIVVPKDVPGLEKARVESKPTPVEYKIFSKRNGELYSLLVPHQGRCTENPELIGSGEKS